MMICKCCECLNVLAYHYEFYLSFGKLLLQKQKDVDLAERDYRYVPYLRKATDNTRDVTREHGGRDISGRDLSIKEKMTREIMYHEGLRDYFTASLRQINHLIQFDQKPNLELMEPKWELYKVSISFQASKLS